MNIGIVGLGLIGGSLAKAFKKNTKHKIFGFDIDTATTQYAAMTGDIDKALNDENINNCDYIFLSVYPAATIEFVEQKAELIRKSAVVIDCGGIKRSICKACAPIAKKYGFTFIGGHPMAGMHYSGYKFATADLFDGASMILTPDSTDNIQLLEQVTNLIKSAGFNSVTVTTPEEHDKIIAFTSQLAHIVSNAYVKSPQAEVHKGFSAGSYKDLTRVARLNEKMWTELFLQNKDNLLFEIDNIISSLSEYKTALDSNDATMLSNLLKDGSNRKKRIDS